MQIQSIITIFINRRSYKRKTPQSQKSRGHVILEIIPLPQVLEFLHVELATSCPEKNSDEECKNEKLWRQRRKNKQLGKIINVEKKRNRWKHVRIQGEDNVPECETQVEKQTVKKGRKGMYWMEKVGKRERIRWNKRSGRREKGKLSATCDTIPEYHQYAETYVQQCTHLNVCKCTPECIKETGTCKTIICTCISGIL